MKNFIKENKRKLSIILAIAILIVFICVYALVNLPKKVAIENEEEDHPKAITEQQTTVPDGYTGIYDANGLRNTANNLAGKYILMTDIDMTDEAWTPIGTGVSGSVFTGTFEGNNHTISNLTINSANQYVGMFGYINGGTVQNLVLDNIDITNTLNISGAVANTGGIAGYLYNGIIKNVEVSGTITESLGTSVSGCIGGIVGQSSGTITTAINSAEVTGTRHVGGIVGKTTGAIIEATNTGRITGNDLRNTYRRYKYRRNSRENYRRNNESN